MTFTTFYREFLKSFARNGGAARTVECYELTCSQFVSHLRAQGLNDDLKHFNPDTIESFKNTFLDGGLKASSVKIKLSGLSSLGTWGTKTKGPKGYLLAENPVARIKRPKAQRPPEKFLTRQELAALLAVEAAPNERLALEAFVDTCLRVSELAGARVRDLRLDGETTVLRVCLKGGRWKDIPLGPPLAAKLEATLRQREVKSDDPVFVNQSGRAYTKNCMGEAIWRLARRAGITRIHVRPHTIRRTMATLANEAGESLPTIAALLNHSDLSTVQRYVFTRNAQVDGARDRLRVLTQ